MSITLSVTNEALAKLQHIIEANKPVDWRAFSFDDPSLLASLAWQDLEAEREELIPLLKAYQRLLHILPPSEDHRVLPLLKVGLHSAIQSANIPQDQFARQWAALFPGEAALGEAVQRSAINRRSTLLLYHVNAIQSNEPHYRAVRFR
jgi:hypothetical protein